MKIEIFNEKKIKIRKISQSDLKKVKEFQEYINSLIEEEAMISLKTKKSRKEERNWLKEKLKNIKKKKEVMLLAEDKGKIVGVAAIYLKTERQSHVGEFGISVRKEYRGIGLGKKLTKEILKLAKKELKPKLKIVRLSVFSTNKIAQNLYKKFGFKMVAKIPKQIQY
ncbi:MAG: GNAT family N-acetyltransferase, partial [Minisyncoccales bacterium]